MGASNPFRLAVRAMLDGLFPPVCRACGLPFGAGACCPGCREDLPFIRAACPGCAVPRPPQHPTRARCANCQRRPPVTKFCVAPLHYRFPVDAMLQALKFRSRTELAEFFAELLEPSVALFGAVDALVPVPLHPVRHARRGYNQAELIARALGRRCNLPVDVVARRRRSTAAQSGLDREARQRNVKNAFRVRGRPALRHALIVDDVITTGATATALAECLLAGGIGEVSVLAVARAAPEQSGEFTVRRAT